MFQHYVRKKTRDKITSSELSIKSIVFDRKGCYVDIHRSRGTG